jgi:hypothetical protein
MRDIELYRALLVLTVPWTVAGVDATVCAGPAELGRYCADAEKLSTSIAIRCARRANRLEIAGLP